MRVFSFAKTIFLRGSPAERHNQNSNLMKRLLFTGAFLAAVLSGTAGTFYDQLCEFNFNWKKYPLNAPAGGERSFRTDADYVAAHLGAVLPILRSNPVDGLSADQLLTRTELIGVLDAYRAAGQFPLNHYRKERIPVFIDEHGTHCAVGYLMMRTGYEALAQRISHSDNYVWVKDITDPEALVWQQYSGFTMEELKLIQGAYDWYDPMAWYTPNKYETPQMPICTTAYFDDTYGTAVFDPYQFVLVNQITATKPAKTTTEKKPAEKKEQFVWCKGEGNGKVINGKWEQNYGPGMPWIKGFFINGQRSGDWEEYYPGTQILCRTESWRNNKLNGVRKRFDYASRLIEEIIFVEGSAVCKTNYDLNDSLTYVRIPQNDSIVSTRVYNNQGKLIACGKEKIYNPSGLLWFQNIQLTALNSMQVSTRSTQLATGAVSNGGLNNDGGYNTGAGGQSQSLRSLFSGGGFQPALVEYHKIGTWWYYQDQSQLYASRFKNQSPRWWERYQHYGTDLYYATNMFSSMQPMANYDSLCVKYDNNNITQFLGYQNAHIAKHFFFEYFTKEELEAKEVYYGYYWLGGDYYSTHKVRKTAGEYNTSGERTGTWIVYNEHGQAVKEEKYLIPMKEEEVVKPKVETVSK